MVFAVQCPNPRCKKYMLVEDRDRNNLVACLVCKTSIKVGSGPATPRNSKLVLPPKKDNGPIKG